MVCWLPLALLCASLWTPLDAGCSRACPTGLFQCHFSCLCIPTTQVCDGVYGDCGYRDTSDERNDQCRHAGLIQCVSPSAPFLDILPCSVRQVVSARDFSCGVTNAWWCDGSPQCQDGEDESETFCGCPSGFKLGPSDECEPVVSAACAPDQFDCGAVSGLAGQCIDPLLVCDGVRHCEDGTDELSSICYPSGSPTCPIHSTRCVDSSGCYLDQQLCDMVTDCVDGSDELCRLPDRAPEGAEGAFLCRDSPTPYWVAGIYRCDGIAHCVGSGEDERDCGTQSAPRCARGACHHHCRSQFTRSATVRKCSCDDGYELSADGWSCEWADTDPSTDRPPRLLAVLSDGSIFSAVISDSSTVLKDVRVTPANASPDFLAQDPLEQVAFFKSGSEIIAYDLVRRTTDGVLTLNGLGITAMGYDSINDLMVWAETDNGGCVLKVAHRDSMTERNFTLDASYQGNITSLAIHITLSRVYFCRALNNGSTLIEGIMLDGTDRRVLLTRHSSAGNLRVDLPTNMLYFTDNSSRAIMQLSLELGGQPTPLPVKQFPDERRVATFDIFNNQIIYFERHRSALYMLHPISNLQLQGAPGVWLGDQIVKKVPQERPLDGVYVIHQSKQGTSTAGCRQVTGCSDEEVCLPKPRGARGSCVCPDGTLRDPVHPGSCKRIIRPFLVFSADDSSAVYACGPEPGCGSLRLLATNVRVTDIDHDDTYVYWVDARGGRVTRAHAQQLSPVEDVLLGLGHPNSLAVDPGSGTIFWTDLGRRTIEVASRDGAFPDVLLRRANAPNFLTLDLLGGFLLWTEERSKSIFRADMSGQRITEVATAPISQRYCLPGQIAFEPVSSKILFTCDSTLSAGDRETHLFSAVAPGSRSTLPAREPTEILQMQHPDGGFALSGGDLLLGGGGSVRSFAIHDGSEQNPELELSPLKDIKLVHVFKQRNSLLSDPCSQAACAQRCLRTSLAPYYACSCYFGYRQAPGNGCVEDRSGSVLLISHDTGVKVALLDNDSNRAATVLTRDVPLPRRRVGEIDLDPASNLMCYLQSERASVQPIRCVHLLTGETVSQFAEGEDVVSFALDVRGSLLYYSEAVCKCIKVVEMRPNGAGKTLVPTGLGANTFGILLDPDDGLLFWVHAYDGQRRLERIDMDGELATRMLLHTQRDESGFLEFPALDRVRNEIFFTVGDEVHGVDYTGRNSRRVVSAKDYLEGMAAGLGTDLVFGLADLAGGGSHVMRTSLLQPEGPVSYLSRDLPISINQLRVFSYDDRPRDSACTRNTCDFLCLHDSRSFSCACPDGVRLQPGSLTTCQVYPSEFLLLPSQRVFLESNVTDRRFTFDQVRDPHCVDFLYKHKRLFIGTLDSGIFSMQFDGSDLRRIILPRRHLEDIAVDWMAENIYWLESDRLSVADLDGTYSKTISFTPSPYSRSLKQAKHLAIHPFLSYVFISDWETPARIIRVHMDGSDFREIVPSKVVNPGGLAIDFRLDRLLFLDSATGLVQSRSLDGTDMAIMVERARSPPGLLSLAINGTSLFFSEVTEPVAGSRLYQVTHCEMTSSGYSVHASTCRTVLSGRTSTRGGFETSSMAVVSSGRQPELSQHLERSPCAGNVAECAFLCLSSPLTVTCVCPDDRATDQKYQPATCSERSVSLSPSSNMPQIRHDKPDFDIASQRHDAGQDELAGSFQDFELKLVMIVLVIIAVVVIILMVAILLLIRRHMIAAPPPPSASTALYSSPDQSATLLFASPQHRPRTTNRAAGRLPASGGGRLNNHHPRFTQPNFYVEMPLSGAGGATRPIPQSASSAGLFRQANVWTPTPEKNTNLQTLGMSPHYMQAPQRACRPFGSPPPPYQPPTNSSSAEDLQQHSTDDSSSGTA